MLDGFFFAGVSLWRDDDEWDVMRKKEWKKGGKNK